VDPAHWRPGVITQSSDNEPDVTVSGDAIQLDLLL